MKITRHQLRRLIRESLSIAEFELINELFPKAVEMSKQALFDNAYTSFKDEGNPNSIHQRGPNWLFRQLIQNVGMEEIKDAYARAVINWLTANVIPEAAKENSRYNILFNKENYRTEKLPNVAFTEEVREYVATQKSLVSQLDSLRELFVRLNDFNEVLEANAINASSEEMKQIYEIAIQDEEYYQQAYDLYSTLYID